MWIKFSQFSKYKDIVKILSDFSLETNTFSYDRNVLYKKSSYSSHCILEKYHFQTLVFKQRQNPSLFNLYRNTVYILSNYTSYQRNFNLEFHAQISIKILYLEI